jgi:toxin FitB
MKRIPRTRKPTNMPMNNNILDSSAWIECLDAGPNAARFRPALDNLPDLLVPSITITEVRKVVRTQRSLAEADTVTRAMTSGRVIPIDEDIAILAADLFVKHNLPLADSLIYATALLHEATLWTQDDHFKGLSQVKYFPKPKTT